MRESPRKGQNARTGLPSVAATKPPDYKVSPSHTGIYIPDKAGLIVVQVSGQAGALPPPDAAGERSLVCDLEAGVEATIRRWIDLAQHDGLGFLEFQAPAIAEEIVHTLRNLDRREVHQNPPTYVSGYRGPRTAQMLPPGFTLAD